MQHIYWYIGLLRSELTSIISWKGCACRCLHRSTFRSIWPIPELQAKLYLLITVETEQFSTSQDWLASDLSSENIDMCVKIKCCDSPGFLPKEVPSFRSSDTVISVRILQLSGSARPWRWPDLLFVYANDVNKALLLGQKAKPKAQIKITEAALEAV